MNVTQEEIDRFLETAGRADDGKAPRWQQWDSFFDDDVQAVLDELHPDRAKCERDEQFAFPILAYKAAEQFALVVHHEPVTEFQEFLALHPAWAARLLAAVRGFHDHRWQAEREGKPETARERFSIWHRRRELSDRSRRAELFSLSWQAIAAAVFSRGNRSGENALKKATHDENDRREKIMRHWARCWITAIRVRYQKREKE